MQYFDEIKFLLETKGYTYKGNLGIEYREAFSYRNKPDLMSHHLYVCPYDSKELHRYVKFRNYLRTHPDIVFEYSKIKEEAAKLYPKDIEKYMEYKFINKAYKQCAID